MDWLMCIMMIILFAAVLVLLWKNYRIKKEAKLFAEKVEDALDAIVTGKEWNMEEELEDSLWGRTGTQLAKAGAPVIGLIDCAGIRVQEAMDALAGFGDIYMAKVNASGVYLILLQGLALDIAERMGVTLDDFRVNHPGGGIGAKLRNEK